MEPNMRTPTITTPSTTSNAFATARAGSYSLVVFRKPDLDTVFAASLLLGSANPMILAVRGLAPAPFLANPRVLCLECGGSGDTRHGNFDHHDGGIQLACATRQAWESQGSPSSLAAWVEYVSAVDTATPYAFAQSPKFTLSSLFSGMLLCRKSPCARFRAGLRLVRKTLALGLSPESLDTLVENDPEVASWHEAKLGAIRALEEDARNAVSFAVGGLAVKALVTAQPGVHGLLRREGADISVAGLPSSKNPGTVDRWSISLTQELKDLVPFLQSVFGAVEPGWGGPCGGTIFCSPFAGSHLSLEDVREHLTNAIAQWQGQASSRT